MRQEDHLDGADGQSRSTAAVRSSVARSVAPSSACATPRTSERGRHPAALGGELIERQIGVGERPLDAVGHHVRPQGGDPRLDRRAAVRERDRRGRTVGEREPALGLRGPPGQHADPGSVDGERRVAHQVVVAEPPEPLLQGLHAAVVVERQRERVDQAGDGVGLAGGVPVDDRRFGQVVGDAPGHRPAVELGHDVRLAALELVAQQLAEQVVVAIPLAAPVERHDEAVRALERLERLRPTRVVWSTASQRPPHMRSSTEVCLRNRASAAGSRDSSSRRKYSDTNRSSPVKPAALAGLGAPACIDSAARYRPAGQPSVRSVSSESSRRVELDSGRLQQQPGLPLVQPEVRHADLVHPARAPASAPSGSAGSSRLAIAICEPAGTYSNSAASTSRQEGLATACRSSSTSTSGRSSAASALPRRGDALRPGRPARAGQRVEHLGRDRLDAVDRGRDVAQEHDRVVVPAVERDPGERTRIGLGPAREERRLAVPGRRDHGRERRRATRTAARSRPPSPRCRAGSTGAASLTSTRSKGTSVTGHTAAILRRCQTRVSYQRDDEDLRADALGSPGLRCRQPMNALESEPFRPGGTACEVRVERRSQRSCC